LLRQHYRREADLVRDLIELARKPEVAGWLRTDVEDWINESLEGARQAYRVPGSSEFLRSGMRLGRDYQEANLPLAVKRLAQAGMRLSDVLNESLRSSEASR